MKYRVAEWATGNVGRYALRAIINHPELELVGVIVSNPEKNGVDAAKLCGLDRSTGILATTDVARVLALKPDCICYTAGAETRLFEAVADMARVLEAGINVVSCSVVMLVWPECPIAELVDPLRTACEKGRTSFLTSGIDPGFANDIMPLMFTGLSEYWTSVRMQEIVNYATYEQADTVMGVMGFGKPMDEIPYLLQPGILSMAWGGTIRSVAGGLGVKLDEINETYERRPADEDIVTTMGTIKKGTAGALRFEVRGIVAGKPAIVLEHVTRMSDRIAPDWPQGHGYHVIIEGEPRMRISMEMEDRHGDLAVGGIIQTATRLVNAIPAVVEHKPGLMSALDLPLITGKGLYRAAG